ncbi:class I SAM-dependent methyltransferase [Escherichia coli]|uniref:class I SAM-dependent methyltransferase n=1 Tax=Escherichia coli TaxID=562 RepID=UPI000BB87DCB|nr:class I SAM-dependent methyltransferase [Escherichia coli]EFN9100891.1 class I SAM-dependent methyltransferase [Escherichia coli]EIY1065388.1 class I SAM-dependent methyltransferase [Escherichia coli]ELD1760591.1 class I SAM-dependent methyltransferase [Escherichia coli]ELD1782752.1 class I SAM-dependent methyltransferase [Escherichia coli]ELJ4030374.1 class I SAM-dependent methyltransferase [Escherichia coli]
MANPWEALSLKHYEAHMQYQNVQQAQILNAIMKKQFNTFPAKSICILGISGGNGLEHIDVNFVTKVYGIDINHDYLKTCRKRFFALKNKLILRRIDLTINNVKLPESELVIANLIIEYLGCEVFKNIMSTSNARYLSCVIQKSQDSMFVSSTPFDNYFHDISSIHNDIYEEQLIDALYKVGFRLVHMESLTTANAKILIKIDFERK